MVRIEGIDQERDQRLHDEDAGAHEHEQLYARRDEAAPVEIVAAAAECDAHSASVRRRKRRVKEYGSLWLGVCDSAIVKTL